MPSLLNGEPLSFTNVCIGDRRLEEPLISALENGLDFFGLRLLTPLRPICFSLFLYLSTYRHVIYDAIHDRFPDRRSESICLQYDQRLERL